PFLVIGIPHILADHQSKEDAGMCAEDRRGWPQPAPDALSAVEARRRRRNRAQGQEVTMQRLRRSRGDDRGTAALELALVLPIFLLLVYGGLSFGLAMAAKGSITEAAAEGARSAIGASVIAAD